MRLFDAYLMVDWSANGSPKSGPDSIWYSVGYWHGHDLKLLEPKNPNTRHEAFLQIHEHLMHLAANGKRVLVGFDFAYGYPAGFAEALGMPGSRPWLRNWSFLSELLIDQEDNRNNRFEVASWANARMGASPGPFWACPQGAVTPHLTATKGVFPHRELAEYRLTEKRLREAGNNVQSVWKLYAPGSVGSQVLTGVPRLLALRTDPKLKAVSRVWPFETGFTAKPVPKNGPFILHAEIWPGVTPVREGAHAVKDAAQVVSLIEHLGELDLRGSLGHLFAAPAGLSHREKLCCVREEGWILGGE